MDKEEGDKELENPKNPSDIPDSSNEIDIHNKSSGTGHSIAKDHQAADEEREMDDLIKGELEKLENLEKVTINVPVNGIRYVPRLTC